MTKIFANIDMNTARAGVMIDGFPFTMTFVRSSTGIIRVSKDNNPVDEEIALQLESMVIKTMQKKRQKYEAIKASVGA